MHAKRHALLSRLLIQGCGGLEAAAEICRLSVSQLQRFCDPRHKQFMPADVIVDLQGKAGPIYSQAMSETGQVSVEVDDLVTEVCETSELSLSMQNLVRKAAQDGQFDANENAQIDRALEAFEQQVRDLRAARERGRS